MKPANDWWMDQIEAGCGDSVIKSQVNWAGLNGEVIYQRWIDRKSKGKKEFQLKRVYVKSCD